MKNAIAATLVTFTLLLAAPATAQDATRKDFDKLCSDMAGRWVGQVTWVTDWPGMGTKGDTVTAYWEGRMSADGNLMIGKFFGGDGTEIMLSYYNPAKHRIRWTSVDSGGTIDQAIVYKQDGKWIRESEITKLDGTTGHLKGIGTITDGGKTWTWIINGKIGDDVVEDTRIPWRKVGNVVN